jgi:hypothetical protein
MKLNKTVMFFLKKHKYKWLCKWFLLCYDFFTVYVSKMWNHMHSLWFEKVLIIEIVWALLVSLSLGSTARLRPEPTNLLLSSPPFICRQRSAIHLGSSYHSVTVNGCLKKIFQITQMVKVFNSQLLSNEIIIPSNH